MLDSFESFYRSDLQGFYALCILPLGFLVWRALIGRERRAGVEPDAAGFLRGYTIVFAIETMLDPFATGPLLRWLDTEALASWVMLPFVLLGDFRVFLLVFFVADPRLGLGRQVVRAAVWTLAVPLVAGSANVGLGFVLGDLPGQVLWILYECAFLALAVWLRRSWVARHVGASRTEVRTYLSTLLGFVALYYALWAAADVLILFVGLDLGWGLRVIPNQLYYGFWVPFVYGTFFRAPSR